MTASIFATGGLVYPSRMETVRCPNERCPRQVLRPRGSASLCARGHEIPASGPRILRPGECELFVPFPERMGVVIDMMSKTEIADDTDPDVARRIGEMLRSDGNLPRRYGGPC